jgi:hypothetical protein
MNCKFCEIRVFDSDRSCPACGAPIREVFRETVNYPNYFYGCQTSASYVSVLSGYGILPRMHEQNYSYQDKTCTYKEE